VKELINLLRADGVWQDAPEAEPKRELKPLAMV